MGRKYGLEIPFLFIGYGIALMDKGEIFRGAILVLIILLTIGVAYWENERNN